jgi:hypothetical protein
VRRPFWVLAESQQPAQIITWELVRGRNEVNVVNPNGRVVPIRHVVHNDAKCNTSADAGRSRSPALGEGTRLEREAAPAARLAFPAASDSSVWELMLAHSHGSAALLAPAHKGHGVLIT